MQLKLSGNFFYWYSNTIAVIILCLVYLDIPAYIYAIDINILPKYWYYVIFIIAIPILLKNFRPLLRLLLSPFALWLFALIIVNFVYMIDANKDITNLVFTRNQNFILAILFGFIFSIISSESYKLIFPILSIGISVITIIDFLIPGVIYPIFSEGTVLGRAAGTYLNPNKAGEAILLMCFFSMSVVRIQHRTVLIFLAGIAILLTFSRSALILWLVLFISLLSTQRLPKSTIIFTVILLFILPVLFSNFEYYLLERNDLESGVNNLISRLNFFQDHDQSDDSSLERLEVLNAGIDLFLNNYIFGAGVGTTELWQYRGGTHNQFISYAAQYGIIGIIFYVLLIINVWKGNYFQVRFFQRFAVFICVFFSLFTHNMLDHIYWLLTFSIITERHCGRKYNVSPKSY
jgi:O-antigen ligase